MKIPLRLALCFLLPIWLCASHAFSQGRQGGSSLEELEPHAKMVFRKDIGAGKLTARQATVFFKCANDRYTEKMSPDLTADLSEATKEIGKQRNKGGKLSDAQKERYGRAYKTVSRLQQEAEDSCRKELNIDPSVKRIYRDFGDKRK
ncbi:MAG: hypothetical protein LBF93_04875 [Zoogloeaceae bacterium]|jgi:hypothetical protein|nr:hypothetical protein [Zoogloeaceae bacterium]